MLNRLKSSAWAWLPPLLALLAFARALPGDFLIIDDDWLVSDNLVVLHPTPAHLKHILNPFDTREDLGSEYLPLRDLSYTLDALVAHAGGWPLNVACHATQSLLYALTTFLVVLLARRLTGKTAVALVAGALFALHPVHAEAVCWISSRKDVLGTVFVLVSLLLWRGHWTQKGVHQGLSYVAAWTCYVAAMMCKSPMIILPGLLLACDLFFPPDGPRRRLSDAFRLAPFFAVALAFKTVHVTHAMGGLISTALPGIGRFETALSMSRIGMRYLGLLLLPLRGCGAYPPLWSESWGPAEALGTVVLATLALGAIGLAWRAFRTPLPQGIAALGLGLAWLGIALAPASNLLYRSLVLMADRYLFLPSVGVCLAAAAGLDVLLREKRRRLALGLALAAGLAFLARDVVVCRNWLGPAPQAKTILREGPVRHNFPYRMLGRQAALLKRWPEALNAYRKAALTTEDPHQDPQALAHAAGDLAALLAQVGRHDEALAVLDQALARFPNHPRLLGIRGRAWTQAGHPEKAERDLAARARVTPWQDVGWMDLGIFLNNQQRFEEARKAFDHAHALAPENAEALYYLGVSLQNLGRLDEAERTLGQAMALTDAGAAPAARSALANLHLGLAYAWLKDRRGPASEARDRVAKVETLMGRLPDTRYLLGCIAREERDEPEAERCFREALSLKDTPPYRIALAELLRQKGVRTMMGKHQDLEAAYAAFTESLTLFPKDTDTRGLKNLLELASGDLLKQRFDAATRAFAEGDAEAACRGFLGALEIRPDFFEARFDLGMACARRKDWAGAAEAFQKAGALEPGDFETQLRLGDALKEAGRGDEARKAWERAGGLAGTEAQRLAAKARMEAPLRP